MIVRPSVSIDQAAAAAGVSRRTIYYWIKTSRLETMRTIGGSQRVYTDSIPARLHRAPQPKTAVDRETAEGLLR